jgi:hypothetical protein
VPTIVHGACPPWLEVNPFSGAHDYVLVSADKPAPRDLVMCAGCQSALCDDGGKRYVGCDTGGGTSFTIATRVDFQTCAAMAQDSRGIICVASCAQ